MTFVQRLPSKRNSCSLAFNTKTSFSAGAATAIERCRPAPGMRHDRQSRPSKCSNVSPASDRPDVVGRARGDGTQRDRIVPARPARTVEVHQPASARRSPRRRPDRRPRSRARRRGPPSAAAGRRAARRRRRPNRARAASRSRGRAARRSRRASPSGSWSGCARSSARRRRRRPRRRSAPRPHTRPSGPQLSSSSKRQAAAIEVTDEAAVDDSSCSPDLLNHPADDPRLAVRKNEEVGELLLVLELRHLDRLPRAAGQTQQRPILPDRPRVARPPPADRDQRIARPRRKPRPALAVVVEDRPDLADRPDVARIRSPEPIQLRPRRSRIGHAPAVTVQRRTRRRSRARAPPRRFVAAAPTDGRTRAPSSAAANDQPGGRIRLTAPPSRPCVSAAAGRSAVSCP